MFLALFYQYLSFKARPLKKPGYLSHKSTADPKAAMLRHWFPFNAEPAYGKSINSIVMVIIGRRAPPANHLEFENASELESFNFTAIARSQFHGLAGRRTADCSGAREQRMSEGLTSATRRQKKSSNFTASPSNSGKN